MPETMATEAAMSRQSKLYRDFLERSGNIKKYFLLDDPRVVAQNLGNPRVDRDFLCDILAKQNEQFGSKKETSRNIEKLRHEDTLTVFAGQQPGLFGGPLLTLYKAIGIVKKAVLLQGEIGRPVVPVFWIACDDHDFAEVNHTYFAGREGEAIKVGYDMGKSNSVALAEVRLRDGEAYDMMVRQTKEVLGETDFTEDYYSRLFRAYSKDNSLVRAFALFMNDILPDLGLIFFCPADKDIKTISKSFFKKIVEGHFKLKETLAATEEQLLADGYHIQAEKKETAVHLFYHEPERIPLHFAGDDFAVGDKRLGLPAIIDLIDKYPERFSPDVLTRPVWQSYLFPVVAQAGGPSEIAYFGQIGRLFELFKLVQPYILTRPGATLVEKRQQELLERYNIALEDLVGDQDSLVNKILAESFPEDIAHRLNTFKEDLKLEFDDLAKSITDIFKPMEPMAEQTYAKIDAALSHFEKKVYAHHKRENETTRQQLNRLGGILMPNRDFQERSLNIGCYIAKYGHGVVDYLVDKLDGRSSEHQLIYLSEYRS